MLYFNVASYLATSMLTEGASAALYSIIETAKANGHEPYWYLRGLFEKLPLARTESEILELAPIRSTSA